jgi:siroheme synthase (precorrin-2 oxidase/ferrochelatase)
MRYYSLYLDLKGRTVVIVGGAEAAAPVLSQEIMARLEAMLPSSIGALVELVPSVVAPSHTSMAVNNVSDERRAS